MIPVCRQYGHGAHALQPARVGASVPPHVGFGFQALNHPMPPCADKYDAARENDMQVIARVAELAERHGVPMARAALAWHMARGVESPIVGCSKPERVDDAVAALDVVLTPEEIAYLEEPYRAHELVGPLARPGEKPLAGTTDLNKK